MGKGIFPQWRFLPRKGVPAVVVFEGRERAWYERFSLETVGAESDGEGDDMVRYAVVRRGPEPPR